jgi:hypothetical protein
MKANPRKFEGLCNRLFQVCWMYQITFSNGAKPGAIARLDGKLLSDTVAF